MFMFLPSYVCSTIFICLFYTLIIIFMIIAAGIILVSLYGVLIEPHNPWVPVEWLCSTPKTQKVYFQSSRTTISSWSHFVILMFFLVPSKLLSVCPSVQVNDGHGDWVWVLSGEFLVFIVYFKLFSYLIFCEPFWVNCKFMHFCLTHICTFSWQLALGVRLKSSLQTIHAVLSFLINHSFSYFCLPNYKKNFLNTLKQKLYCLNKWFSDFKTENRINTLRVCVQQWELPSKFW